MKYLKLLRSVFWLGLLLPCVAVHRVAAEAATAIWKEYVEAVDRLAVLPDFSYAGYRAGEVGIPETFPNLQTFPVTDFGAVPDDQGCDQAAIEKAIRAAERAGGGVVFFPPGEFRVNSDPEATRGIEIKGSHIVLKGSGAGPGGTVIFMVNHMRSPTPHILWENQFMFTFSHPDFNLFGSDLARRNYDVMGTLAATAERGAQELKLADVRGFAAGDRIVAWVESTNPRLVNAQLHGREPQEIWERILTRGVAIQEMSRVLEVVSDADAGTDEAQPGTLVLSLPLTVSLDADDPWRISPVPYVEECGFEDIHFRGNFQEEFVHHKNYIHDSGWQAVKMKGAVNSWVRRCVFTDVNVGVSLEGTLHGAVLLCKIAGNRGHFAFTATFGGHNLIGCNLTAEDRGGIDGAHGAGASHLAHNTAIWRFKSAVRGVDFHGTFPRNTLSDLYESDVVTRHGGNYKNLPNHMGGLVIWNFKHTGPAVTHYDFWKTELLLGSFYVGSLTALEPVVVGWHGAATTVKPDSALRVESEGAAVMPESLFEAQLRHRLGELPAWVQPVKDAWVEMTRG